jgi:hypothetical protein
MARFHIHPTMRLGALKNAQILDINAELSGMKIENDLRREVQANIRRLRDMGTYRGRRHAMGLPVRGQNTRTQVSCCGCWRMGYGRLTLLIDHDGKEIEQDRAWRYGQPEVTEDVVGWNCNITCTKAWDGVNGVISGLITMVLDGGSILPHLASIHLLH